MIPPAGFKAEMYPLRHRFNYRFGLSAESPEQNSTIITLVKNYGAVVAADTVDVNPHHASFDTETGAICQPMAIIDKLKLVLNFDMGKVTHTTDHIKSLKLSWMPIFFSFVEKLDAQDEKTNVTVKSILNLTTGSAEEDVTPAFSDKLFTDGPSELAHPVTTVNFTELFGTLNLTTNTAMEGVPFNKTTFLTALQYYTNKGALKACVGKTRNMVLTLDHPHKSYFIRKFVPRPVRRIVSYSYFGILIHCPLYSDVDQTMVTTAVTADKANVGVTANVVYDEWHPEFNQDMVG